MKNDISEDYCSFEVSKLLKEKGFLILEKEEHPKFVDINGRTTSINRGWWDRELHKKYLSEPYVQMPTHALAIKWIRENFGINIISPFYTKNNYSYALGKNKSGFTCDIQMLKKLNTEDEIIYQEDETGIYDSPKEATEAALLYTLTNLIE